MDDETRHPEKTSLEAFALGRLEAADMERIEAHLARCPACGDLVRDVPDDHLVALLRRETSKAAVLSD